MGSPVPLRRWIEGEGYVLAADARPFRVHGFEGLGLFTAPCHHGGRPMVAPYEGRSGSSIGEPAINPEVAVDHAKTALRAVGRAEFDRRVAATLAAREANDGG